MRRLLACLGLLVFLLAASVPVASADGYVNGYYKSNGTYVQGYNRSSPNSSVQDNYSYKGNVNPYTGSVGTKSYDPVYPSYSGSPSSASSYGSSSNSYGNSYSYSSPPSSTYSYSSPSYGSSSSYGSSYGSYDSGW